MEIKERIIQGASVEFYKYGVRTVTMDDLARSMGVSKRTIYENFKDKSELLLAVVQKHIMAYRDMGLSCMNDASNVIQGLAELFVFALEYNSKVSPLFFRDVQKYYPEVNDTFCTRNKIRDYTVTRLLFEKGLKQGIFREDIHLELANETLQKLFMIKGDELSHLPNLTPKDIFRDVFFAYLFGLSTLKGQEVIQKEKERLLSLDLPSIHT